MLSQNEDRKEDGEERSMRRGRKKSISRREKEQLVTKLQKF